MSFRAMCLSRLNLAGPRQAALWHPPSGPVVPAQKHFAIGYLLLAIGYPKREPAPLRRMTGSPKQ